MFNRSVRLQWVYTNTKHKNRRVFLRDGARDATAFDSICEEEKAVATSRISFSALL